MRVRAVRSRRFGPTGINPPCRPMILPTDVLTCSLYSSPTALGVLTSCIASDQASIATKLTRCVHPWGLLQSTMVRHMEPMIRRGQMKDVAHKTLGDLGLGQVPVLSVGPDARVIDAINMISKNKVGQTTCAS
jgi:hypothetical protein